MYIKTLQDMVQAVEFYGILPLFANSIKGFSIQEICDPRVYFSEQPGIWEWKGPVIQETGCAYGKFFAKQAAFITKELYFDFANWRRGGYDFDARFDEGYATYAEKYLYNLIDAHYSVLSKDLKVRGGYLKPRSKDKEHWEVRKGFDTTITKLQMQGYVVTTNFEYPLDKNGNFYGWGMARYAIAEKYFGNEFENMVYRYSPEESYRRLFEHLRRVLYEVNDAQIEYFLK